MPQDGIILKKNQLSRAFLLIGFMVGDLYFLEKKISVPNSLGLPIDFSKKDYQALKKTAFVGFETQPLFSLSKKDSFRFYQLVDLVCKCFVSSANDTMRNMAFHNMKMEEEEYYQVRVSYIHYADKLLQEMNEKFKEETEFIRLKG